MLTNEYIAGFFDGEGYATIRRSNRTTAKTPCYRALIGFTNTDLRVLTEIQNRFGGKIYPKSRKATNHKPA